MPSASPRRGRHQGLRRVPVAAGVRPFPQVTGLPADRIDLRSHAAPPSVPAVADWVLKLAEDTLRNQRDMTLREYVELLRGTAQRAHQIQDETRVDCRWCGRPTVIERGRRIHLGPDGNVSTVGCRSASYDYLNGKGWDDTLKPSWKATT